MIDSAVVLALDNQMYPSVLTYDRSRIMLPVLGKPMAVRMMEQLYRAGVRRYLVMIGEGEGALAAYLHARWMPDVTIEIAVVSSARNIGKALSQAARLWRKPFIVAGYNCFTHEHFVQRLLRRYEDLGGMSVISVANSSLSRAEPYAFAHVESNRIVAFGHEKTPPYSLPVATLGVVGGTFVEYLASMPEGNTSLLNHHFLDVAGQYLYAGGICSTVDMAWILPAEMDYDLLTVNKQFLETQRDAHLLSELPTSVQIIPPVRIDPGVSVGIGAQIGPLVYLESGSSIGRYSIVSHAVVLRGAIAHTGSRVRDVILHTRGRLSAEGS